MDYIIASTVVTDEIRFADKKTVEKKAGGAGIYALCGIRLWCDSVMPVTGVGKDYAEMFGEWYKKNHISMDGLIQKDEKTPYNVIQYFEDGERSETALYGADHYRKIEVTPKELEPYFQTAKGIYIFKNTSPEFWNGILPMMESSFQTRSRASCSWRKCERSHSFCRTESVEADFSAQRFQGGGDDYAGRGGIRAHGGSRKCGGSHRRRQQFIGRGALRVVQRLYPGGVRPDGKYIGRHVPGTVRRSGRDWNGEAGGRAETFSSNERK